MKTPTEVQADMIMELEARLKLSDDDVFYLRHNNITLTHEVERLRDENAAMRATSRGKEKAKVEKLERENAELRADKERLDWLEASDLWPASLDFWPHHLPQVGGSLRAAIDAARKEAQP